MAGDPKYFEELGVPKEKIPKELFTAFEGVKGSARGDQTLKNKSADRDLGSRRAKCRHVLLARKLRTKFFRI